MVDFDPYFTRGYIRRSSVVRLCDESWSKYKKDTLCVKKEISVTKKEIKYFRRIMRKLGISKTVTNSIIQDIWSDVKAEIADPLRPCIYPRKDHIHFPTLYIESRTDDPYGSMKLEDFTPKLKNINKFKSKEGETSVLFVAKEGIITVNQYYAILPFERIFEICKSTAETCNMNIRSGRFFSKKEIGSTPLADFYVSINGHSFIQLPRGIFTIINSKPIISKDNLLESWIQ